MRLLCGLFVAFLSVTTVLASADETVTIPRGTIIPVRITKEVRIGGFGNSTEEHKVKFEAAQDVVVDGHVIVKSGDLVEAHYTNQRNSTVRAFSTDVSQEVDLSVDDVVNYCGDTIHLGFDRTYVGGGRTGFGSFGPHAHDAVFSKGLILKASTDRRQKDVCADATSEANPALPNDMVVPDAELSPSPSPAP